MKTAPVLAPVLSLLGAAAVVSARESISGHNHNAALGICRSSLLPPSLPFFKDPTCPSSNRLAGTSTGRNKSSASPSSSSSEDDDDGAAATGPWTSISHCSRNGTASVEYCLFFAGRFAGGRGISIVTSRQRAEVLAGTAAFTDPEVTARMNRDLDADYEPVYRMVQIPGKDLGLVAARTLHRGDHIMSNTPSTAIDYAFFEHTSKQVALDVQVAAADALPERHRSHYLKQSTHSSAVKSHADKVDQIMAINAYDVDADDEEATQFYIVLPEISRANHDCRPNADYYYDPQTMTQHVHAVRTINIGEEITVSYIDTMQTQAARLARLNRSWGFSCGCSQCTQKSEMARESDSRLAQIAELRREFHDYTTASRATPQMGELMVSLYRQERLDMMLYEALTYTAIEYNGVGEPWMASKYARLAVEYGLASAGPRDNDVVEMRALVADPHKHWSWMLRTSKRMGWGRKKGE